MVVPGHEKQLESFLTQHGIKWSINIDNVQHLVDQEQVLLPRLNFLNSVLNINFISFHFFNDRNLIEDIGYRSKHLMTWSRYHSLNDMYSYLDYLEKTYDFVSTDSIGKTFENRDMRVAKVCKGGCGKKKAVWIDGGIHAR